MHSLYLVFTFQSLQNDIIRYWYCIDQTCIHIYIYMNISIYRSDNVAFVFVNKYYKYYKNKIQVVLQETTNNYYIQVAYPSELKKNKIWFDFNLGIRISFNQKNQKLKKILSTILNSMKNK